MISDSFANIQFISKLFIVERRLASMKGKRGQKMNKKGLEIEMLVWWIIAFVIAVIAIAGIIILKGKGTSALDFIKNLFRFK